MANISVMASNYCGTSSAEFDFEILKCEVKVPGVFSPSAQFPENRYFNIVALELHEGNNVKIFDRWGRKCYDVNDYHLNPWDGGKESDGVYYYVIERPEYEPELGTVHLTGSSGQ